MGCKTVANSLIEFLLHFISLPQFNDMHSDTFTEKFQVEECLPGGYFLSGSLRVQGILLLLFCLLSLTSSFLLPFNVSFPCFLTSVPLFFLAAPSQTVLLFLNIISHCFFNCFFSPCLLFTLFSLHLHLDIFIFLLLTYLMCPSLTPSIPSPPLNYFLMSVIACAIFVEFALTLLTPRIRLIINFQVSP